MKKSLFVLLFIVGTVLSSLAYSTVYLKNGSIIKGYILEYTPEQNISLKTADGSVWVFNASEIIRIQNNNSTENTSTATTAPSRFTAPTGYRGFVDVMLLNLSWQNGLAFNITTSHGYQFNHYAYLGAGIGIDLSYTADKECVIPIFAEFRGNVGKNQLQFTYGARLGAAFGTGLISYYDPIDDIYVSDYQSGAGLYTCASVGLRIAYSPNFAVNLSPEISLTLGSFSNFSTGFRLGFEF